MDWAIFSTLIVSLFHKQKLQNIMILLSDSLEFFGL